MKKLNLMKKGIMLGALAFSVAMMSGNPVKVEAAETVEPDVVVAEEVIEPVYATGDLVIPAGTTEIEDKAFYNTKFTGTLTIPEGVTKIGDYAFYGCGFKGELVIPESVEYIGEYAFYNCDFSGDLMIPEAVKTIGEGAFFSCDGFKDGMLTVLGDEVVLGSRAFELTHFADAYVAGTNNQFPYKVSGLADMLFDYGTLVHAPYNSTARTFVSTYNTYNSGALTYTQWEGRYDIEDMGISAKTLPMEIGESKTLTLNIVPAIAADQTIYWESSNEKVATVKDGVVTAVGYGVATIEAYTSMGDTVTCQATILPFTDVNMNSWEYPGICYVYGRGIMNGVSATEFQPGGKLTRSQFVTVLHNYSGTPSIAYTNRFKDVPAGQWYTSPVLWAADKGITAGYGDTFGVNDNITREQLVTMLYSFAKNNGFVTGAVTGNLYSFEDADKVQDWAKEALLWATQNEIVSGKPDKYGRMNLDPQGTATRAECATIIKNFDAKYVEE